MRRPAQPDRTAPQRCGAALFFSAGAGCAVNKKAPEECSAGTAGCAQGSRTASTDPRSAAAAAPADAPCGYTGRFPPCEQAQIQQAPEDAAGFLQAGGHPLQREHPAQPCQQHHGAHRTASLNLFSLPLFHPASPVFCAVPRCFFSIISHPRCNLPESRGECTSVPLASALKTV